LTTFWLPVEILFLFVLFPKPQEENVTKYCRDSETLFCSVNGSKFYSGLKILSICRVSNGKQSEFCSCSRLPWHRCTDTL